VAVKPNPKAAKVAAAAADIKRRYGAGAFSHSTGNDVYDVVRESGLVETYDYSTLSMASDVVAAGKKKKK
jgi:hypothetical protein